MSIVAIQGGATGTGTVTVVAPSTSINRTLTLPDQTATVLTNSAEVLNIGSGQVYKDASGKVGIGTSSPSSLLHVSSSAATNWQVRVSGTSASNFAATRYYNDAGSALDVGISGSTASYGASLGMIGTATNNPLTFKTNDTERARIDSSGNLLVGRTTTGGTAAVSVERPANTATYVYQMKSGQVECTWGFKASTDSNMYIGSGSTSVGTYGVYLTNTGSSWNAVSDERMKTIVEPIENAADKVASLRAVIGYYNNDEKQLRRPFLIAQDVQAVLPEAVNIQDPETGTLGMSYTDTIPLLVAAIQEQQTLITALTARITALEAA